MTINEINGTQNCPKNKNIDRDISAVENLHKFLTFIVCAVLFAAIIFEVYIVSSNSDIPPAHIKIWVIVALVLLVALSIISFALLIIKANLLKKAGYGIPAIEKLGIVLTRYTVYTKEITIERHSRRFYFDCFSVLKFASQYGSSYQSYVRIRVKTDAKFPCVVQVANPYKSISYYDSNAYANWKKKAIKELRIPKKIKIDGQGIFSADSESQAAKESNKLSPLIDYLYSSDILVELVRFGVGKISFIEKGDLEELRPEYLEKITEILSILAKIAEREFPKENSAA